MKKISSIAISIIIGLLVFSLGFNYKKSNSPKLLYQVYLDDQVLGVIESKEEMENYIANEGNQIKENVEKYQEFINYFEYVEENRNYIDKEITDQVEQEIQDKVIEYKKELDNNHITSSTIEEYKKYVESNEIYAVADSVYVPEGLEIKKISTYNSEINSVEEIYNKIIDLRTITVKGYQITIKYSDDTSKVLYVLNEELFKEAMQKTIETFTGKEAYEKYLNDEQEEIKTVGEYLNNVYVDQSLTIKEVSIPTDKKIYTNVEELTNFLLFGTTGVSKTYSVQLGDTIKTVADKNKISVEEFFISNPEFNSESNVLSPGRKIKIGKVNPIIDVIIEKTSVEDAVKRYKTEYQDDSSTYIGLSKTIQEGVDGLDRVTSQTKIINGSIIVSKTDSIEELSPSIPQIVSVGTKYQYNIGSLDSWGWPAVRGGLGSISSWYGWNTGRADYHTGIDIMSPIYSDVYAVNNGTVIAVQEGYANYYIICYGGMATYGNYVIINHNNGYYTMYAHLSSVVTNTVGQTVARGDVIGKVGMTGCTSGPHVHLEVWMGGAPMSNGATRLDPMTLWQ